MIPFSLDKNNAKRELYLQLYDELKRQIIHKEIPADTILPSKRVLAGKLDVSVKTIENAYNQLLMEGYIRSAERKGYYANRLDNYRSEEIIEPHHIPPYSEHQFRVDFRSNKNSLELFPSSTWFRFGRETLSYNDLSLFATVPFQGVSSLRNAIADYLFSSMGMKVSPEQIIIGAGTEYLYARLMQLFEWDKDYAIEDYGSRKIYNLYNYVNARYKTIPFDPLGVNIEELEASGCNVLHVAPANHYPMGRIIPVGNRVKLLEWVNRSPDRFIIEDDYDSEYHLAGNPIPPLFSIDLRGKVIYLNTFSKTVFPALKIAYMVLPVRLLKRYRDSMNFYSCSVPAFDQALLARFIESESFARTINRIRKQNTRQCSRLMHALIAAPWGNKVIASAQLAGPYIALKCMTNYTDDELVAAFHGKDILLSALSAYTKNPQPEGRGTLILNYSGITDEQIDYFIEAAGTIL